MRIIRGKIGTSVFYWYINAQRWKFRHLYQISSKIIKIDPIDSFDPIDHLISFKLNNDPTL